MANYDGYKSTSLNNYQSYWSLHGPLEDLRQCMGQVDWIIAFGHNLAAKVPDCARIRKDLERRPRDEVVVIGDFSILYHTVARNLVYDIYKILCLMFIYGYSVCLHAIMSMNIFFAYMCSRMHFYHSSRKGLVPLLGRLRKRVVGVAGKAHKFSLAGPHMCHISYLSPEAPRSKFV